MKRSPFLIFFMIVTLLVGAALWFIQSRAFAQMTKTLIARYLPTDLGIDADFSEFAIRMFPPGLSLKHPKITLRSQNVLKMPKGSSVQAERIDFDFRPLQMITGNVRVHELVIVGGDLQLFVDPPGDAIAQPKSLGKAPLAFNFHWDELFQVHAEAVVIQDSRARVEWRGSGDTAVLEVKSLRLGQWLGKGGIGYEFDADLSRVTGTILRQLPWLKSLEGLQATAHVNSLGVQIDRIHLKAQGLEVQGNGMVRGNLQTPQAGLQLDADLSSDADIGLIAEALHFSALSHLSGLASFNGRVRGNLMRALESLRLQGEFSAKDFAYQKFRADQIQASGTWAASPQGGEVDLARVLVTAQDHARTFQLPARGGKLELSGLKMKIGSTDPVRLKLLLERADVQWLASIGLVDLTPVFPVLGKLTGSIEATVVPPAPHQDFRLDSQLKLKVEEFQLDNQKLAVKRPELQIFKVPQFTLEGPLSVDARGLRSDGHSDAMTLTLPHSQLKVTGDIDFKNGFNFYAGGPVSLADLGMVAENAIRGDGPLSVHVHGPAKALLIDVDVDAKDAYYVHLNLGDIRGRITWDDDKNRLLLHNMAATKGGMEYGVDGLLDLDKVNRIALTANIPKGNMQDFLLIFHDLTKDLWWFPQSLTGPFSGEVKIGGGVSMSELQIAGRLGGSNWDYLGERFTRVALQGGYDRGKYQISDFRATKRSGRLYGRISFDQNELFNWDFHTQQLTVSDLDHVAQLDVPLRGRILLDSSGKGKLGSVLSESQLALTDVSVRGVAMPPSQLSLSTASGIHTMRGALFGSQGILDVHYDFNPTHLSRLKAEVRHLDFSPILLLLNPKSITDPQLAGNISGSVALSFRSGQVERADGDLALLEYSLAKNGTRFQLVDPVSFHINDGSFELGKLSILASGSGRAGALNLELKSHQAELNGKISGTLDVSIAEFFTSTVQRSTGGADLDFRIGGAVKSPTLTGQARLAGVTVWVQSLESPFEHVNGALEVRQNALYFKSIEGDLAGGRTSANGTILLFADRYPLISLKGDLTGNKLRFFPFQYVKVKGAMSVTGDRLPYLVEGNLTIDSALSREKVFQQNQAQGLKAVQYTPPPSSRRLSDYPKFKLKIEANADKGILVQNDLFDAEFKAKVTIVNTIETPRILGSAELVQGKMVFKDRAFQIQSANATFDSPTVINPHFNLISKTDVNGVKVQLYASGTLEERKIELSSTPVMSETDILSLLAIGISPTDSKKLSASDRSTIESGEAASLLLHSLDFNREVQDKTGIQIQLNESTNSQVGTSVFRPPSVGENGAAPKIVIKKQLTKNFDVSYGSTVGVGTSSQRQVNAEMKVTPGFSVIGVWDNYESVDSAQEKTNSFSYGLDLKLQKRFK